MTENTKFTELLNKLFEYNKDGVEKCHHLQGSGSAKYILISETGIKYLCAECVEVSDKGVW